MRRLIVSAVSAVALVGSTTSPAAAAITVGQSGGLGTVKNCTSGVGQLSTTTAPPSYVIPSDGVITSFTAASNTGANTTVLLIVKPVSSLTYNVVAESPPAAFTSTFQTFPARIPVQAGELIANYNKVCAFASTDANDVYSSFTGPEPAVGANQIFGGPQPNFRIDLSAQLEPDADHDGYGDETQDQCPSDANTQGPCPLTPASSPSAAATGERGAALKKCKKKHGRARHRCIKRADTLPA
jgi:hypothetical protein